MTGKESAGKGDFTTEDTETAEKARLRALGARESYSVISVFSVVQPFP